MCVSVPGRSRPPSPLAFSASGGRRESSLPRRRAWRTHKQRGAKRSSAHSTELLGVTVRRQAEPAQRQRHDCLRDAFHDDGASEPAGHEAVASSAATCLQQKKKEEEVHNTLHDMERAQHREQG